MASSERVEEIIAPSLPARFYVYVREAAATPLYTVMLGLTVFYGIAVYLSFHFASEEARLLVFHYNYIAARTSAVFFCLFVAFRFLYIGLIKRPERLVRALADDLRNTVFSPRRVLQALPVILLFPVFFSIFTSFKYQIPHLQPFSFDPLFATMDKAIHGGRHPWEILQPVIGFAFITFVIGCVYKFWFLAKFCVLYWQAFSMSQPVTRAQFFLSTMLAWIINGSVFAVIFSSAGPCYFHLLFPEAVNPYAGLMDYLHATNEIYPIWDVPVQELLWQRYSDNELASFSGISAFPSMHVSYAFIFLLTATHYGRVATALATAFFMFTVLGSVHLGWHYAVDGYFSILTTFLIWVWCGRLVRKFKLHEPRTAQG